MANLTRIPAIDDFETQLSSSYNGGLGTINVTSVPSGTIESGETSYLVINPGKSNMQVVEIDGWDSGSNTFNVVSVTVEKGNGVNYTAQTHAANSIARFSNNYAFRKDIRTAVNSKISTDSDVVFDKKVSFSGTDTAGLNIKKLTTTQRDALTPTEGDKIINSTLGVEQTYIGGSWVDSGPGATTPNLSETTTGKGRYTNNTQYSAGTDTDGSGNPLLPKPSQVKASIDTVTNSIPVVTNYFGFASDGNVVISTDTTLTRDMFYGNLTINNGVTLYPNGYKIFCSGTLLNNGTISRIGNTGGAGTAGSGGNVPGTGGAAATLLNQGTLNDQTTAGAGGGGGTNGVNGTSVSPAYTNTSGVSGGAGGTGGASGGTGGTATQGSLYNTIFSRDQIIALLQSAALSLSGFYTSTSYKICGTAGGGGSGTSTGGIGGGGGGGGGGHGGLIYISAKVFNNQGTITCSGGIGGAGGSGGTGGGGGGGGNGGVLFLIRSTLTNLGTVNVSGGVGGAGGSSGSGFPGSGGSTGNAGTTIQITV